MPVIAEDTEVHPGSCHPCAHPAVLKLLMLLLCITSQLVSDTARSSSSCSTGPSNSSSTRGSSSTGGGESGVSSAGPAAVAALPADQADSTATDAVQCKDGGAALLFAPAQPSALREKPCHKARHARLNAAAVCCSAPADQGIRSSLQNAGGVLDAGVEGTASCC